MAIGAKIRNNHSRCRGILNAGFSNAAFSSLERVFLGEGFFGFKRAYGDSKRQMTVAFRPGRVGAASMSAPTPVVPSIQLQSLNRLSLNLQPVEFSRSRHRVRHSLDGAVTRNGGGKRLPGAADERVIVKNRIIVPSHGREVEQKAVAA